jgi:hypothetical protein
LASPNDLPRENQRSHPGEVARRYWTNQTRHSLPAGYLEAISAFFDSSQRGWPTMSSVLQGKFAKVFDQSNLRLCEKYQLPAIQLTRRDRSVAATGRSMDDIFGIDICPVLPS